MADTALMHPALGARRSREILSAVQLVAAPGRETLLLSQAAQLESLHPPRRWRA